MRRTSLLLSIVAILLFALAYSAPANAQATRTWVSGEGDDANPCSRTAPCKTFAGTINKTAPNGIINCLDPGGFGTLTITKGITIDCHETIGSVLAAGTNGITINVQTSLPTAGPVTLRGLDLEGIGSGLTGINIVSGTVVIIEDVLINQFTTFGIGDSRTGGGTALYVKNVMIQNNGTIGIAATAGATNAVMVDNAFLVNNKTGVTVASGNNMVVSRSVISGSSVAGVLTAAGGQILLDNVQLVGNVNGVQNSGTAIMANSDIYFNGTAFSTTTATESYGNNRIFGNGTTGPTPIVGPATTDHGQE